MTGTPPKPPTAATDPLSGDDPFALDDGLGGTLDDGLSGDGLGLGGLDDFDATADFGGDFGGDFDKEFGKDFGAELGAMPAAELGAEGSGTDPFDRPTDLPPTDLTPTDLTLPDLSARDATPLSTDFAGEAMAVPFDDAEALAALDQPTDLGEAKAEPGAAVAGIELLMAANEVDFAAPPATIDGIDALESHADRRDAFSDFNGFDEGVETIDDPAPMDAMGGYDAAASPRMMAPPAPAARKYMFDRDFGVPEIVATPPVAEPVDDAVDTFEAAIEPEPEPEPPPPPPSYNEAELEAARGVAYSAGELAGRSAAMATIDQRVAESCGALVAAAEQLLAERASLADAMAADAARLAHAMANRLMPALASRYGLDEIESVVAHALGQTIEEPRLIVRVAAELASALDDRIHAIAADKGFRGQLTVVGDATLGPSDVRIDWGEGGAERILDRLWTDLSAVVAAAIGSLEERVPVPAPHQPSRAIGSAA